LRRALGSVNGSSPRLRGTLRIWKRCPWRSPVHPRACGEHGCPVMINESPDGSSPRLRGTRWYNWACVRASRFIPAPAGNTSSPGSALPPSAVHPRACGEHACVGLALYGVAGSSPRLRGTLIPARDGQHGRRFIPAPAGNTGAHCSRCCRAAVHPRACGEHPKRIVGHDVLNGSSPRLRGTPRDRQRGQQLRRFIPAPAGNTSSPTWNSWPHAVHPRACGEHPIPARPPARNRGSSPRLRGTR